MAIAGGGSRSTSMCFKKYPLNLRVKPISCTIISCPTDFSRFNLLIQLTQFEQQFEKTDSAHVVMGFTVSAFACGDYKLLGKRSFRWSQKTVSADAASAIAGFIALTRQAKTDVQIWLETLPKEEITRT